MLVFLLTPYNAVTSKQKRLIFESPDCYAAKRRHEIAFNPELQYHIIQQNSILRQE